MHIPLLNILTPLCTRGITVPIHPLDLTSPGVYSLTDGQSITYCTNAFRPLTIDNLPFDFVLGDSFLRNAYAVYDFGDFDASGNMGKPYVKLLPLTDQTAASASFKKNRAAVLAQLPAEGDLTKLPGVTAPVPPSSGSGSGSTTSTNTGGTGSGAAGKVGANLASSASADDDSAIASTLNKLSGLAPIVLALLGVNIVLLIGLIAMGAFFIVRNKSNAKTTSVVGSNTRGIYAPVTKFPEAAEDDERSRTPAGRYDMPQYRDGA